jgi:ferredoxin
MLSLQIELKKKGRLEFLEGVRKKIASVKELIHQEAKRDPASGNEKPEEETHYTSKIISFEKMGAMAPEEATEGLSASRRERLEKVVEGLASGADWLEAQSAHLIVTASLFDSFSWKDIFGERDLVKAATNQGYKLTEETFVVNAERFADFISWNRIADLELSDSYVEDIHDDFFQYFSWHRITHDELVFFPPVIFVGETQGFLQNNLSRFSSLLSQNKPIRLIALEKRLVNAPDENIDWEDASHSYRQELAAIAIAHRSAHTFQCAINHPIPAYLGMKKCLDVVAPSIMHFLIPEAGEIKLTEILKLSAAVESRFFPIVSYDLTGSQKWGSRFDISSNPYPDQDWPAYDFSFVNVDGKEDTINLNFTYADYKAMTREKTEELMMIPESMIVDDLIPLTDYLEAPVDSLTGKVPYIWLVDEDNCMKRAVLPYMWVVSCQERLEHWNYIQELGGVNSHHVSEALQREKRRWKEQKDEEIDSLKDYHSSQVAEAKRIAAGEAMENLTNFLLGFDSNSLLPTASPKKKEPSIEAEQPTEEENGAESIAEPAAVKTPSAEAWIESFKCTSCNECTDNYPHIFQYNDDKQAIIEDASAGSYLEMVRAAEECPALCIHPGQPMNPDEKDLDELIKRAEKFNQ